MAVNESILKKGKNIKIKYKTKRKKKRKGFSGVRRK